jgi:hypothetical protein
VAPRLYARQLVVSITDTNLRLNMFMLIDALLSVTAVDVAATSTLGRFPGARPGRGLGGQ